MKKSICKECGKELSKKAEICPDCGVRIRFNFKNSLKISLLTIGVLIIIWLINLFGISIRDKIVKMREKKNFDQLTIRENEMFDSYLGNYKLSYNEEIKETNFYNIVSFKETFPLENKCYRNPLSRRGEGNIVDNCISFVNAKTIERVYAEGSFDIYYINKNKSVMVILMDTLINQSSKIKSMMDIPEEDEDILYQKLCFEFKNSDTLEQIKCPSKITTNINYVIEEFPIKYEFKLTKIK